MKDSYIASWMRDWARWMQNRTGHAKSTVIYQAAKGELYGLGFNSMLPEDVMAPPRIAAIDKAMADCSAVKGHAKYIIAMQHYYLIGIKGAAKTLDRPVRTIRWRKTRGEDILRRALQS